MISSRPSPLMSAATAFRERRAGDIFVVAWGILPMVIAIDDLLILESAAVPLMHDDVNLSGDARKLYLVAPVQSTVPAVVPESYGKLHLPISVEVSGYDRHRQGAGQTVHASETVNDTTAVLVGMERGGIDLGNVKLCIG